MKIKISNNVAGGVCKIGHGSDCCKYLMAGEAGLECAKSPGNEPFKIMLDAKTDMVAQGDNCTGYTQELEFGGAA